MLLLLSLWQKGEDESGGISLFENFLIPRVGDAIFRLLTLSRLNRLNTYIKKPAACFHKAAGGLIVSFFLGDAHCRQETAINYSISWQTVSAFVDADGITSAWTHYAIDRAAIISSADEPFLHARNDRSVVTAIDRAAGVVWIARVVVIVTAVSVRIIPVPVRTVWISPIIGTVVIRVSTVVPSVKRHAYTNVPKYATTTAPVITAPVISVIATVCHNCLAVSRLDNPSLGERGRCQRKRDNGTEN